MFGFTFGLQGMAIAIAISFLVGGASGMRVEKKLSDAAAYKLLAAGYQKTVATLNGRIKATTDAAKADQGRAALAESKRATAEDKVNALEARLTDAACFTADDTHGLRQLWTDPGRGRAAPGRPR